MNKKSLQLLAQVQVILSEYDFALTLRQLYYQLVARQIISNNQNEYRKLSRICVIGRDEGILPENMFTDRTRYIQRVDTWIDLNGFMGTVRDSYRKDYWKDQASYVEIWSEKDALRSVIESITNKYRVGLFICRGQASRTAIYEAYERYLKNKDKECYLFYCGDFDPSGISIYNSIVDRIQNYGAGTDIFDVFSSGTNISFALPFSAANLRGKIFFVYWSGHHHMPFELN